MRTLPDRKDKAIFFFFSHGWKDFQTSGTITVASKWWPWLQNHPLVTSNFRSAAQAFKLHHALDERKRGLKYDFTETQNIWKLMLAQIAIKVWRGNRDLIQSQNLFPIRTGSGGSLHFLVALSPDLPTCPTSPLPQGRPSPAWESTTHIDGKTRLFGNILFPSQNILVLFDFFSTFFHVSPVLRLKGGKSF